MSNFSVDNARTRQDWPARNCIRRGLRDGDGWGRLRAAL